MSPDPAVTVGTSLAVVGARRNGSGSHPDLVSGSRRAILAILDHARVPLTVEDIATRTGLHPSTARTHLDLLLADGRIERQRGEPAGKGRPPWLYTAAAADEITRLRGLLEEHLDAAASPDVLEQVAEVWAAATSRVGPAESPDAGVEMAAQALSDLGFDAEVSTLGDSMALRRCPYAALASEVPQVCEIHGALLAYVLRSTQTDVELVELDVWPVSDTCVARLHRPDRTPFRVIRPDREDAAAAAAATN